MLGVRPVWDRRSVQGAILPMNPVTVSTSPQWMRCGIVGIPLAFYLWASLPVTAIWLLGVLLGIQLICEGAALGYLAWQVRTS